MTGPLLWLRRRGLADAARLSEVYMRVTTSRSILMIAAPLIFFAIQAGMWIKSTNHARSETELQNRESRHRPSEIAGLTGMLLLVAEATVLSIPQNDGIRE